jgi:deferrochelatase/peroxidase EfeB
MIVSPQRVGEALWNGSIFALLPERHDDQLAAIGAADVHHIPALEVPHQHSSAPIELEATGRVGMRDARGDLGLCVERPTHTLAKPLGRVVGHSDKHQSARYRRDRARLRCPAVKNPTTRRGFLSAAGLAGVSAGVGIGAGRAQGKVLAHDAQAAPDGVPFFGAHQAGIATHTQEHIQFAALDVLSNSLSDLRALVAQLSSAAALLSRGDPVGPLQTGATAPVDTGESVGLSTSRLTVTFGLGPSIFARGRFGLAGRRPAPLVVLPAFAADALEGGLCGGDIGVQVCADDPQVAFHAVHNLIRLAGPTAVPRWALAGFGGTSNSRSQQTPRNLMGFKDGTNNIVAEDANALERFVWARGPESPEWMRGGSYMVLRRIQMLLGRWDDIPLVQQEQTFGRHKLSGAPIGGVHEHDPVNLRAKAGGAPVIPSDAHVRLASPQYNRGERLLRRGYSYVDGVDRTSASAAGGLLFICYQRDPRSQFIPIQRRLASYDALGAHTVHVGSAIFACPPGTREGGFVGETLFA